VKLTPDTNVLLRIVTNDDVAQRRVAEAELAQAEMVALSVVVLCELVWTLLRVYKHDREDVTADVRRLINADNVVVDRGAAEAGLAMMDADGDFADGVIAYEGRTLGGECLITFDKRAAALLAAEGETVKLLSASPRSP
jgi:predicted nucleic-acid-binding protein